MRLFRQGWLKTFLIVFAFPMLSYAAETSEPGRLQERRWPTSKGDCALSRFSVATFEHDERDAFGQKNAMRGTMMAAAVETSDPSCLKEYGVVQYIRGCLYNVRYNRREKRITQKYFGVVREQRGKTVPFVFPEWDVDTVDRDPLYNSTESPAGSPSRLDGYRYPKGRLGLEPAAYFDPKNHGFLSDGSRGTHRSFVTDIPTFADWNPEAGSGEEEWVNASLEFRTCVYRVSDVPVVGQPKGPGTPAAEGGPIACFSWDHKQQFDPATSRFRHSSGIDAACSTMDSSRVARALKRSGERVADAEVR